MTNEELDAAVAREAERRWREAGGAVGLVRSLSEVATIAARLRREGWTPPEPVDPAVEAYREWELSKIVNVACREAVLAGRWDRSVTAIGFISGFRMARERERERAGMLISMAVESTTRFRHLLRSLPLGVRVQLGVKWDLDEAFVNGVEVALAKYNGEA
jgi:hypothetical protein